MDFQTDCGLFEEQTNQEVFTPPVKDSCLFLINEDSGLGMDIVSSIFFTTYPSVCTSVGRPFRPSSEFAMFVKCLYNACRYRCMEGCG